MSEALRSNENTHNNLRMQLLSGLLSREDFLTALMDLDQAEPSRVASIKNVDLLTQPEIQAFFLGSEVESSYCFNLGFAYFHKAQISEFENGQGISDFKNSLEMTLKSGERENDWVRYIKATIAYLENNSDSLKELIHPGDANELLLRNMVKGLENRGAPSYFEDYSAPRT